MPGIYLHIPFCKQACTYCDFYFSTQLSGKEAVTAALVDEISLRSDYLKDKQLGSIYFGGGTPSLLSPAELERIFGALKSNFSWKNDTEITLEANPDDITREALKVWKAAGINRLSIGLQSFNEEELKWMNRAHTADESVTSVKMAQDEGFDNITIDLIYGSKFQTLESWEETLKRAIALNTQHISSYNLTIENKTVLGLKHSKGKEPSVNEELSSAQFLLMSEILSNAGFEHYEISNFGKKGYFAKHNSNYWLQQHYLGIGPSAHSFNGVSREWNVKNNTLYVKALKEKTTFSEREELSLNDRYNEYILTRLRTIWGCDLKEIKAQFGEKVAQHFKSISYENKDHLREKNDVFTLTKNARLLADGIASDFFLSE